MKRALIILLLSFSIASFGQYNAFWQSHANPCRPYGLPDYEFCDYADDTYIAGSWQNAFDGYDSWRDGTYAELAGIWCEVSSLTLGQTVWLGTGVTNCDKAPNGFYLVDCATPSSSNYFQIIQVTSGVISRVWSCLDSGNFGYLYNWHAANGDTNGDGTKDKEIAPSGWHMPTITEWQTLRDYLNTSTYQCNATDGYIAKAIASATDWDPSSTACEVGNDLATNNTSGFYGTPTGYRTSVQFAYKFSYVAWWSASSYDATYSSVARINGSNAKYFDCATGTLNTKVTGIAIRLIKDNSTDPGTMTDYDGNVYPTVKIGDQVWMAKNLRVTKYNDGTSIPEVTNQTTWAGLTTGARCVYDNNGYYK